MGRHFNFMVFLDRELIHIREPIIFLDLNLHHFPEMLVQVPVLLIQLGATDREGTGFEDLLVCMIFGELLPHHGQIPFTDLPTIVRCAAFRVNLQIKCTLFPEVLVIIPIRKAVSHL